ncbi:MAG: succinate dehydrogenase/fumarate reductase iron-sulfur subunit [Candidatus Hodarchaeota archaeon]
MNKTQKFLIYRKNLEDDKPHYERFEIPLNPSMSVLEALFFIQDHIDPSLAFRYACRGAICGSCGITIDKFPQLACKTQVLNVKSTKKPPKLPELSFGGINPNWNEETEILIEPLPNMNVIKDLVVDMEPFWNFYSEIQPFFTRKYNDIQPESLQNPTEARSIEHLVYCILCGICWTCPVNAKNMQYIGPAALAKAYRFIADTRLNEEQRSITVNKVSGKNAVLACEKYYVCNRVCPKNVRPGTAIKEIRENWLLE